MIAGRYTLVDVIGEGGMGSVYLAEQTEPVKRPVALKLIKSGMDSQAVLARFDAERQALAVMDHPNIARVYDGGTTPAGQPFFVMELVQGVPLTQYCDQKRLSLQARLELFVQVCHAVQHAHQKGIIHRDLKPGNVLVTEVDGRPTPKVIDFGVAKATELKLTDLSFADVGVIVGTPAYMSPEQADPTSMDIDTRTDVYALGVMLYELLTGSPPLDARQFQRGAILEMLRLVREVEPPRPSTKVSAADDLPNIAAKRSIEPAKLARSLRGELDWVVMKALEKDRTRRYDTANALARDLQRYLADEVVEARPPSAGYRLKKFVRRHKGQVIAAGLVLCVLLIGIVGTTWGLIIAREETAEKEEAWAAEALRVTERDNALALEARRVTERDAALGKADKALDRANHQLDNSAVLLATAAFDNRDAASARLQLHTIDPKRRGWEWHYLRHQLTGGIFTLYGHTSEVKCVAFSPDGTRIATGAQDGPARLWDATTGKPLLELNGNKSPVLSMAFSPDGARIVTAGFGYGGGKPPEVKVWDTGTGALLLQLPGPFRQVNAVAFSPDGTRIATGSKLDSKALVWDAKTGKLLLELQHRSQGVMSVAFSPDGNRIVTGPQSPPIFGAVDNSAIVWDAKTGRVLATLSEGEEPPVRVGTSQDTVVSAAFSPDGNRIVTGTAPLSFATNSDYGAKVYDARTGKHQFDLTGHTSYVNSVAFSPDGSRIVTGSWDRTAKVWDAKTGRPQLELKGHADVVRGVAFSPDGERILTGSDDRTAKLWDARTGTPQVVELKGQRGTVISIAFSPDGSRIVTGSEDDFHQNQLQETLPGSYYSTGTGKGQKAVTVWDARTGTSLLDLEGHTALVCSVAFSPDGSRIVTGSYDQTAKVWNAQTGKQLLDLKGHTERLWGVAFSPDNARVATSGADKTARVWDAESGKVLLELKGHTDVVTEVAFSPDGARIVTSSADKTAKVWDTRTGKLEWDIQGHTSHVTCVAFSRDSKRILTGSGAGDTTAKVWDAKTGTLQLDLKGHGSGVVSVAFNRDGTRILTGSQDRTAKVWDAETGSALLDLKGHSDGVGGVAFSPDGTRIALTISSLRAQAKVWDARSDGHPLELSGHTGEVKSVAFSSDGTRVVTGSVDRTAKVWDAKTGKPQLELKGHTETVFGVAFSPDGTRIATGSGDRTARVWDASTGALQLELKGHTSAVMRVAFSLDGKQLVTGLAWETPAVYDARAGFRAFSDMTLLSRDGSVHWEPSPEGMRIWRVHHFGEQATVWDAQSGQPLKGEPIPSTVPSNRLSPDGRFFGHADGNQVECIRLQPDEQELAYRRRHTQPNLERYREGYRAARTAREDFTARFYLNLLPLPERTALAAKAALDDGKKDEAVALYRKAIELDPRNASLHITLGAVLSDKGEKDEALALWYKASELDPKLTPHLCDALLGKGQVEQAVACIRRGLELDSRDAGLALKLAALQAWFGQEKELTANRRRILAFARGTGDAERAERAARACSLLPANDPAELEAALTLGRTAVKVDPNGHWNQVALGMAEYRSGHFADAEKNLAEAAPKDPDQAQGKGIADYFQAMCLYRQGKKDEARKLATEAAARMKPLPADEKNPLVGGASPEDLILWLAYKESKALIRFEEDRIPLLQNQVRAHLQAGKRDQAVPLLVELVTLQKAKFGPDHPATLALMNDLGVTLWQLGQFGKSVPVFEEQLKLREAKVGRNHPDTLNTVANLGVNYKDAGRLKEALPLLEEAYRAAEKHPQLQWVGGQLLDAYAQTGENDKFANLFETQMAAARKNLPRDSPQLASFLSQVGLFLLEKKKWAEAESVLRECLTSREKTQPDEWTTFNARSMLGGALLGQKKYAEAAPLLLKGYAGIKQREKAIPPQGAVRLPEALDRLIELYTATSKPDEAKKWQAERAKYPAAKTPPPEKK